MNKNIEKLLEKIIQQNEMLIQEQDSKKKVEEKLPERALEEATSERSVIGQKISLTELLDTNTKLIKDMLNGSKLMVNRYTIGRNAKTNVNIFYVKDLVDKVTLSQVKAKISKLEVNYLINLEAIIDELKPKGSGLFPTTKYTERYDTMVSDLLQGKVVVICDHTPYALVAPITFWELFQTEVEYSTSYGAFTNRLMRMFGFLINVFLPSVYIAMEKFHLGDIKSEVIKGWFEGKEVLSPFWEMVIIIFVFKIASDVSLHIYKSLGLLVTIIATLVVGEYSVTIHLISATSLVVAGLAQLSGLLIIVKGIIPLATTLSWSMLIVANFFGFTGLIIAFTLCFIWATSLKPFGVPYLSPFIPFRPWEFKDSFWRGDMKKIINSKHSFRE